MLLEGRTPMHAPEIDVKEYVNEVPEGIDATPGEFYRCEIVEAHDYDLVARIV
jgi:ribosomal protein S12 methylthiotransferase